MKHRFQRFVEDLFLIFVLYYCKYIWGLNRCLDKTSHCHLELLSFWWPFFTIYRRNCLDFTFLNKQWIKWLHVIWTGSLAVKNPHIIITQFSSSSQFYIVSFVLIFWHTALFWFCWSRCSHLHLHQQQTAVTCKTALISWLPALHQPADKVRS